MKAKKKKKKLTADDLLKMKFIGSVVMSPDETMVAFTVKTVAEDNKKYFSHIYVANTDGTDLRQFTSGEVNDSSPIFSPDGEWIVFVSKRGEKKGVYKISTQGGEASLLIDKDGSFSDLSVSPDGKKLLCVFTKSDELPKDKQGKKEPPVFRHIDRLFYKLDGAGFLPKDRGHVHIFDMETGEGKRVVNMKNGERSPVWFPYGRKVAFISNTRRNPDVDDMYDDIFVVSLKGGKPRKLNKPDGPAEALSVSPDGKYVAFLGHDEPKDAWGTANIHVWKAQVGGKTVDLTPKFDRQAFDLTISDTAEGFGAPAPIWSKDGKQVYFLVTDSGATHLYKVSASGRNLTCVIGGKRHVSGASMGTNGKLLAVSIATLTSPCDVYVCGTAPNSKPMRITTLGFDPVKQIDIQKPKELIVRGHDGYPIHGWIITPPGFSPRRKYPSIMQIHGGPRVQYGYSFFHEMQLMAAQGYVVYFCNPRGGQGYGRKHAEVTVGSWGTVDYEDCMSMARHMADQKYIDASRMGVTGGSYGGYMTNWIVSHTDFFKAAVTQRSVTNFISMYGSSDIGYGLVREVSGTPYTDTDHWWEMSPIKHVRNIKTPLLIIHSEQDLRCPIEQGEQLFIALKMLGRKTEMVRFPGEPHGLSRDGRPDRRLVRLDFMMKWFDKYLKGRNR